VYDVVATDVVAAPCSSLSRNVHSVSSGVLVRSLPVRHTYGETALGGSATTRSVSGIFGGDSIHDDCPYTFISRMTSLLYCHEVFEDAHPVIAPMSF
jgi:hypothetical protein